MNAIKEYYGKNGSYLKDHESYLSEENLKRDTNFIINSLGITTEDKCLELQCAQGRITIDLNLRGYKVDGLDFSEYMISLAQKSAKENNLSIDFFVQDLNKMNLKQKYTKVFMFFPDWTDLNFTEILPNISRAVEKWGLFLYDHDNLFRIWNYLEDHPEDKNNFDSIKMVLGEKTDKTGDRYYTYPELKQIFEKNWFEIIKIYGGWKFDDGGYGYNSPRQRIVAKKIN